MTPEEPNRHDKAADAVQQGRPVKAEYVRGARPGLPILYILIASTGAAALLLFGLWTLSHNRFEAENPNTGNDAADVQAFDGDAARPPAADAPTTATGDARPVPTGESPNVNAPTVPSNTVQPAPGRPD